MLRTAKGAFADNKQLAKSNPAVKKNKKSTNSTKKVDILTPNRRIQKLFLEQGAVANLTGQYFSLNYLPVQDSVRALNGVRSALKLATLDEAF